MDNVKTLYNQKIFKNILIVIIGTLALTISAKIKIPFYPVPMTMQTFVVLFLGIAFGYKLGLVTVGIYLIEGILGLPVFSNSPEKGIGIVYFTGPTMGYLIGFMVAAFLIGYLKLEDWTKKNKISVELFFINLTKLVISVSTIYIFGLIWLGILIGWDKPIFKLGALPFLYAELFKILVLAFLTPYILKIKRIT